MYTRALTALFATALVLGGCAGESETKLEPGQKAFVFESGVVPIGDFDTSVIIKEDLFDPCNEISDEEFARAGFTGEKKSSTAGEIESPHGYSMCAFTYDDGSFLTLGGVTGNKLVTQQTRNIKAEIRSEKLPEMYVYQGANLLVGGTPCIAQIDTVKGAIGVGFSTRFKNYTPSDICAISKKYLEALYTLNDKTQIGEE